MSFGQRLKLAIKYRKLTQKDVASAMQVTPQNLNQYIRNRRQPSKELISKLAKILELEFGYTPEGEPFFYIFPKVLDFPDEMTHFNTQQIMDALGDPDEEIHFDNSDLVGSKKRVYKRMDKLFAFTIQFDLLKLNVNGKALVSERVRELLKNPKYRIENITNDFLSMHPEEKPCYDSEQNNTAPDELLAAHQREDIEPTKEGIQHDLDIMNDEDMQK